MTYFSARLLEYPQPLAREQLEHRSLPNRTLTSIPHLRHRFGPYHLADWAKSASLEVYYVDNCWARVPLTGVQLKQFYIEQIGSPPPGFMASIREGLMYLLEAEEF